MEKEKKPGHVLHDRIKKIFSFFTAHPVIGILAAALVMNLTVESLGRHSLIAAFRFIFNSPWQFLLGAIIIAAVYSLGFLVPRRRFAFVFISLVWLGLGIGNCVVLCFRKTPLGAIDFILLKSTISIIGYYLNVWQIVLVSVLILSAVACVIVLWIKSKPVRVGMKKFMRILCCSLASVIAAFGLSVVNSVYAQTTGRLTEDYDNNGFTYSFCSTFFDRGITEPEDYSERIILDAVDKINAAEKAVSEGAVTDSDELPNIIFVQLESVMDISHIKGLSTTGNPTPNFTALKNTCPHGELNVPVTGCGTANTEFEILTGMKVHDFGAGEFPYNTVLLESPCESAATNLKTLGYAAHTMHNNTARFYSRDVVFSSMGFDTYTSVEFMDDISYNEVGWAKDDVLTAEIERVLASTEERDFIYTISVQPHGSYPERYGSGKFLPVFAPSADGENGTVIDMDKVAYYLDQLYEVDLFIGELVDMLGNRDEPTVLVLFGDHIPELGFDASDMDNDSIYKTDYVIWDSRRDLYAEELSEYSASEAVYPNVPKTSYSLFSYVCQEAGLDISGFGAVAKLEAYYPDGEEKDELRRILSYDMLYGECYQNGDESYEASELGFGTEELRIDSVTREGDSYIIKGKGFTPFTSLRCGNNDDIITEYIDGSTLKISEKLEAGDVLYALVEDSGKVLKISEGVTYSE